MPSDGLPQTVDVAGEMLGNHVKKSDTPAWEEESTGVPSRRVSADVSLPSLPADVEELKDVDESLGEP